MNPTIGLSANPSRQKKQVKIQESAKPKAKGEEKVNSFFLFFTVISSKITSSKV